jgi:hypothetical protein
VNAAVGAEATEIKTIVKGRDANIKAVLDRNMTPNTLISGHVHSSLFQTQFGSQNPVEFA